MIFACGLVAFVVGWIMHEIGLQNYGYQYDQIEVLGVLIEISGGIAMLVSIFIVCKRYMP